MPAARHPFLDHPGPIAFAHRGGAAEAPENTMVAFERAVALGYGYVETDARITADGVLVAFHDARLDATTDRRGVVEQLRWDEVARARVGGVAPIPRLDEVLLTWPDLRVNIDPKSDAAVAALVALIEKNRVLERVALAAFSEARLARLRSALGPGLCTALGPVGVAALRMASLGVPGAARAARSRGACAQIPPNRQRIPLADARLVATAHRLGLPVHVWTIDEPVEMHRLLDLGVDGLMSDRPEVLKQVLLDRGAWV